MTGSDHKHNARPHPKKGQHPAAHHPLHPEPPPLHAEPRLRERPKKEARGVPFATTLREGLALAIGRARTGQRWVWRYGANLRRSFATILRRRWVQRLFFGASIAAVLVVLGAAGLWWRLAQGPIEFDMATPWLKSAIEQNFGGDHVVEVGGAQIERNEKGRPTLRLRDIVVRDGDGAVVASAPKAEVGMSGTGLLSGQLRAESLNLVGARLAVRIERDGEVTVFAGADKRPIATSSSPAERYSPPVRVIVPNGTLRSGMNEITGALAWIDAVSVTGLDGHDLDELGLKNGQLTVDDRRNGKHWTFDHINASLRRPAQGGVIFQLGSDDKKRPWLISAAMRPLSDGVRAVGIEARQVSLRDILLALRVKDGALTADLPLSASIRADIAADGTPQRMQGEVIVGAGTISSHDGPDIVRIGIDRADLRFDWNMSRRSLIMPIRVQAEGNQFTLRAALKAPDEDSGVWQFAITRGNAVIDPVILVPITGGDKEGLALNRVSVRGRIDVKNRRIDLDQADFSRSDTRPSYNVGIAVTGSLDYSKPDPHLAFGVAGTRMPIAVMKRLWPVTITHNIRQWVEDHVSAGTVERIVIAGNAPLSTFASGGVPVPDDGLSVDIETTGTSLRPVRDLPPIDDADLAVRVTGSTATVRLGRGVVTVAPGRSLNIANGVFSVPDTNPDVAPAQAGFRIDGSVPAAAMLLANPMLSHNVGIKLDPATSRGTVAANVTLNMPLARTLPKDSVRYAVSAVLSSFSAEKALMGEKLEAASLHVAASSGGGYRVKGDVKINGMPAEIDVNNKSDDAVAELKLSSKLDEAARRKLGIDFGDTVKGIIPVKLTGKLREGDKVARYDLDADLTRARIDDLLPGWEKAPGQPAQLTAIMMKSADGMRFDKLAISGSGVKVEGEVELDKTGDLAAVDFPVFSLSEGDKASLKAVRGSDDVLRVTMRGDVYDGRAFVRSLFGGSDAKTGGKQADIDLDIKIGTVLGHNGETLRGLDLKLARRSGTVRNFVLRARIGRDAELLGDLRLRARDNHRVVYVESADAGALFRFVDMYARIHGGKMWVAMDPPRADRAPQVGILFIRDFAVRGEQGLDRIVAQAPDQNRNGVPFSEMHADFTRFPGKMAVRNGVVRGPLVGATISGQINYTRNDVHLRGTLVPFYGLNNMFGQIPIVGLVLGAGANEGLVGITYEAVGPIAAPQILVNPVSAIAPGVLRKFIPTPGTFDPEFIPPSR